MNNPELSIIIVSWNVKDLLKKCLQSIEKYRNKLAVEIIVVDNASKDGTVEMLKTEFPDVRLITNSNNLGFAAANNQGILRSQGDYILLLNPDTEVIKDTLNKMLNFIKIRPQIGILGCKHLNPDWTLQPSVRRFPAFWAIFFILTKLYKIFPNIPPIYYYFAEDFNYKISQPIDQVAGSCMMIRRQTIEEIGLLDERFFIWFEEVDLCKRSKDAGWEVWYTPDAELIHYGGQSFRQVGTWKKQKIFFQSAIYYFRKHGLR
ncbi:MAG: glycosyltransferase family 2 protein [Candidatus Buchananbacteria bacterium]|nr:glycosyltransferase family 2 protein [Candidatus Buchananbacteria bacterium]